MFILDKPHVLLEINGLILQSWILDHWKVIIQSTLSVILLRQSEWQWRNGAGGPGAVRVVGGACFACSPRGAREDREARNLWSPPPGPVRPPTNVWPTENQRKVPPDHVRHGPGSHRKARDRCVAREVLVALALRPGRRDGKPSRADGDGVGRERTSRSRRGMEGRCAECCGAIDSRHGTAHTQLLAPRLRRRLRAVG